MRAKLFRSSPPFLVSGINLAHRNSAAEKPLNPSQAVMAAMKVMRNWVTAAVTLMLPIVGVAAPTTALPESTAEVPLSCARPVGGVLPRVPVAMSFRGGAGQPVKGAILTVSKKDGSEPATIACNTSQIFLALAPGGYIATVDMDDGPTRTVDLTVSPTSPNKFAVRFPTMMAGQASRAG